MHYVAFILLKTYTQIKGGKICLAGLSPTITGMLIIILLGL